MPVVHAVGVAIGTSSAVAVGTVLVRTASELSDALKQRDKAVVIDDPRMADRFRTLQSWQEARMWFFGSLIAALIALSISQNYKVELSWHRDWKVNTMDGKVTLTPVERK